MVNLFLKSNNGFEVSSLTINSKWISKKLEKLFENSKNKEGTLFIYNNYSGTLYMGEFTDVKESEDSHTNEKFYIRTINSTYFINLTSFKPIPYSALKYLYSKNNEDYIGQEEYSIYTTLKNRKFTLAYPYIEEGFYEFINFHSNKDYLKKLVLYDDAIIPNKIDTVNIPKEFLQNKISENSSFNKIYGKLIEEDDHYIVTLTNKKMIELDLTYLENEGDELFDFYRPYFYEFIVDKNNDGEIKKYLSDNDIEGYYEIEITTIEDSEKNSEFYSGELIFSASPSIRTNAFLRFIQTVGDQYIPDNINQLKDRQYSSIPYCDNQNIIRNIFENLTRTPRNSRINFEITIYNVGQGNWIKIEMYSNNSKVTDIIFDIGRGSSNDNQNRNTITKDAAEQLNSNSFFILSHWDLDHIEAVNDLEHHQFLKTWFVPDIRKNSSNSAFRLLTFLNFNRDTHTVFISENLNKEIIIDNDHFTLGKGGGLNTNNSITINGNSYSTHYNDKNNLGLVLEVKGANENFLFTGDCEYIQLPDRLRKSYNYITVSHHGATTNLNNNILPKSRKLDGEAIACVGRNASYPKRSHVQQLNLLDYDVINTRDFSNSKSYRI